jgi:CopG family nickel-responsive transcriptional regulator
MGAGQMSDLERIGVSLEGKLLGMFDDLIQRQGYANRSEAIRDLIRDRLSGAAVANPDAEAVAVILLVYDHHASEVNHRLTHLQHSHLGETITSLHVHLDHDNCLEVIVLKGKVKNIKETAEAISAIKGVKLSRFNVISTGDDLP